MITLNVLDKLAGGLKAIPRILKEGRRENDSQTSLCDHGSVYQSKGWENTGKTDRRVNSALGIIVIVCLTCCNDPVILTENKIEKNKTHMAILLSLKTMHNYQK